MNVKMNIPFSPPDIGEEEIKNVIEALKSGWITTGPKTKQFEKEIAELCHTEKAVCLNSATAALEMTLRVLGIGEGDEVITSSYTYTASASPIAHVGAKIVLVDIQKDSFEMDYEKLADAITEKTKAIIPVDIAGVMCNYEKIFKIVDDKKNLFTPNNDIQKLYNRVIVISDCAHALGAQRKGKMAGEYSDFSTFSFHAVKNLTTAEGGAVVWKNREGLNNDEIYKKYQLLSLHGQTKDALHKNTAGAWEYDIVDTYYKCNMTDICASIGLAQMERYSSLIKRRQEIIQKYNEAFKELPVEVLNHKDEDHTSSGHLYLVRIKNIDEQKRNEIITKMAERGISCNVHYKPLPMLTAYKKLGFNIEDYPNAYNFYKNEVTLPLYTKLTDEQVDYIIENFKEIVGECTKC